MRIKDKEKFLIIVVIALFILLTGVYIYFINNISYNKVQESTTKNNKEKLNSIIENIKSENQNLELVYETKGIPEFTSITYKELATKAHETYKSFIIDTRTGKKLAFTDLIKPSKKEAFQEKEEELLKLKYPEFILTAIKDNKENTGYKFYYVKESEVIIFYYNYEIPYDYQNEISLIINYQEIKDYLNFTPVLVDEYENEDGYKYSKDKKSIALTFDDGPSAKYNHLILEELTKNKAHATFFMVGTMMNSCKSCITNTYNSGNEIASHTYEHMNIKKSSVTDVNTSLSKVNDIYKKLTGANIKYLRPPYGSYNKTNLENINVPLILWDLDTEDWRFRDANHIINYIEENATDGSIILMHEIYASSYEALKTILPKLYSKGFQVVSISELAALKNRTLTKGHAYSALR